MKMNKFTNLIFGFALFLGGCNYLDIVPENDIKSVETIFEQRVQVDKWVATCYRNMSSQATLQGNVAYTGADELVGNNLMRVQGEQNGPIVGFKIGDGLQSVLEPIGDRWNSYYSTIRYCNTFFQHIGETLNMEQKEKDLWTAEVKAVKAFYYFQLVRMYGPIVLLDKNIGVEEKTENMKRTRTHVDTCFKEIVRLLDEAIEVLPLKAAKETMRQGYFFKESALALKAMVLVYQASPLFNGNPVYSDFRNRAGEPLFSTTPDKAKWKRAAEACDEAIQVCKAASYGLVKGYTGKQTPLLNTMMDIEQSVQAGGSNGSEIILQAKTMNTYMYGDANFYGNTLPYFCNELLLNAQPSNGSISPSMKMVEMYYTENGLPIEDDPDWRYSERYQIGAENDLKYERVVPATERVLKLHLRREPRFYDNIAADRLYWRGIVKDAAAERANPMIVEARKYEIFGTNLSSLQQNMDQNRSGYWLMKHIYTDLVCDNYQNQVTSKGDTPMPLIRLAQLLLMSSEAWNEYLDDKTDPRIFAGIDEVRDRAGIPSVRESWKTLPDRLSNTAGLRRIIHRETSIELAFEGQRFWDLRRWLEADVLNEPQLGWNVVASSEEGFYNNYEGPVPVWKLREFVSPRDYFFPLSSEEVMKSGIVQNLYW